MNGSIVSTNSATHPFTRQSYNIIFTPTSSFDKILTFELYDFLNPQL